MTKIKIFKYFASIGCIILFLGGFYSFGKMVKKKWIVHLTLNSVHWKERVVEMEQIKLGRYKTIFLGNSFTELFDLGFYFKDSSILNCGIVGDFTEGLLKRAGTISRLKPDKLFIEIGLNDMIEQISLSEINANYKELIEKIQKESPATKIYLQSNFPVIINRPSILTGDNDVNNLIKKQNENLKALAKRMNCIYIDVYSVLIGQGGDFKTLFIWDGIHFTHKAYSIWAGAVLPYLSEKTDK